MQLWGHCDLSHCDLSHCDLAQPVCDQTYCHWHHGVYCKVSMSQDKVRMHHCPITRNTSETCIIRWYLFLDMCTSVWSSNDPWKVLEKMNPWKVLKSMDDYQLICRKCWRVCMIIKWSVKNWELFETMDYHQMICGKCGRVGIVIKSSMGSVGENVW